MNQLEAGQGVNEENGRGKLNGNDQGGEGKVVQDELVNEDERTRAEGVEDDAYRDLLRFGDWKHFVLWIDSLSEIRRLRWRKSVVTGLLSWS